LDTFIGQRLGKYQIESLLGRGGMATVYRAHDTVLNRSVAIKVLDPTLAIDPKAVERFKREAVTAANLEHPAIVRVYDVQQQGNLHYIAMRYVQGTTLRDILHDNGPLPLDAIINIIRPVAEALHYAHRHGVIHRDVKPGNILVEPDGSVLLTDFGIARAADNAQSGLTATGLVMGTADYLAPEQISGKPAEPRSDIYSLGVVLYEMLTGVTPFAGENTASILYRQVHDNPPSLRSMNPRLPAELQPVVDRTLAKNPALRYADPLEMVQALHEAAQWIPPGSPWLKGSRGVPAATPQNGNRRPSRPLNGLPPVQVKTYTGPQTGQNADAEYWQSPAIPERRAVTRRRGTGRRTMLLIFALTLIATGAIVLGLALDIVPGFRGGTQSRFQAAGPPNAQKVRTGNGPDIRIPKALQAITTDGDLSDWEGTPQEPAIAQYPTTVNRQWAGPQDLGAQFYFAWDDNTFYVAAVVTDNVHVQFARTRGYNLFKGDDIEIWFDTDLPGDFDKVQGDKDDFQLGLSPGNFADLGPEAVFWNPEKSDARNRTVTVAARKRPEGNGYTLEAAVPWTAFGDFRPKPGMAIGFAASAGDNDRQNVPIQETMLSTVPGLVYLKPLTFGNLFF